MTRYATVLTLLLVVASVMADEGYHFSDGHLHVLDFFQQGESLDKLLQAMDQGNIDHAMICGAPLMKKWHEDEPKRPRYYAGDDAPMYWYSATDSYLAEALRRLPEEQRKRLHPFISGINPTDKNAVIHLQKMVSLYPGLWQGIGEVLLRHDDLTAMTPNEPPRANSEAMHRVYRFAALHDFPVLIHTNITSKRERNPLYLAELEEALEMHPDVKIIWAHAGTSKSLYRNQGAMDFVLPAVRELLQAHANLTVDLSWTVLHPYLLDKQGRPSQEWVKLVSDYPDRFILGSDALGRFDGIGEQMAAFESFLQVLPDSVARKVARDNFLRLLPATSR